MALSAIKRNPKNAVEAPAPAPKPVSKPKPAPKVVEPEEEAVEEATSEPATEAAPRRGRKPRDPNAPKAERKPRAPKIVGDFDVSAAKDRSKALLAEVKELNKSEAEEVTGVRSKYAEQRGTLQAEYEALQRQLTAAQFASAV